MGGGEDENKSNSDNKPAPAPSTKGFAKSAVDGANAFLAGLERSTEGIRKPFSSSMKTVGEQSSKITEKIQYTYKRRHEFAPEIIGGSAVLGGAVFGLRRGRIAAVIGAAATGGAAYAIVYDQINLDNVPDIVFGRK